MTVAWSSDQLERIANAEELHIAARGADGTLRREVPIWVVRVGDQVYVRTWYRRDTGWFGHVVDSRRGRIRVPGVEVDITIEDVGDDVAELRAGVDAAYRAKYGRYGGTSVDRMVTDEAAASTLRLDPTDMSTAPDDHYVPSASERARDQVARYEATDGTEGGDLGGRPVVILTMLGAASGAVRKTPIMRVVDGDAYVAIASYAGNPRNPAWYLNLVAHPEAEIRDQDRRISVRAREVHGDEKARLWGIADAGNPAYADYRARAGRDIPILLLEPVSA